MFKTLSYGFRSLKRNPAFAIAAIGILAVGIGATTAMFSLVNAVLLRPLPGFETGRLVRIFDAARPGQQGFLPPDLYQLLRRQDQSEFETIAANQNCRMNFTGNGQPEQLNGPCTTANFFEMLRVNARLGRTFLPDEDRPGRNQVVILDHGFWMRRFGGDAAVLSKTLTLDGKPWVVAGILPPGFHPPGMDASPIYTAYVVEENPHGLNVTARLHEGATVASAESSLKLVAAQYARLHPESHSVDLRVEPLLETIAGSQRRLLGLLLGAVAFVLLIACTNVAMLLLARATGRAAELEIRRALGATGGHLASLVFGESLVLALAGGAGAVLITHLALSLLRPLITLVPRGEETDIDWRVLACSLMLSCVCAVLSGLWPALRIATTARHPLVRRVRIPASLIVIEVAMTFVLVTGAGLLLRTLGAIAEHNLGYNPGHVLTAFVGLPPSADGSRTAGVLLYQRIRERIAAQPGVISVATASGLPMFGVSVSMPVHKAGEPEPKDAPAAALSVVSDTYFQTMEIPLRSGRLFNTTGKARVAMVSESIARRYFSGSAIGGQIILPEVLFNIDGGAEGKVEIVGVVGNVCVNSVSDCDAEHIYLPEAQNALRMINIVVRTSGDPKAMKPALRRAVYQEAPTVPVDEPLTLEERASYLSRDPRRGLQLLGVFAVLGLLIAAAGIYGVAAYSASQRLKELGIRAALGAGSGELTRLMLGGTLVPAALGVGIGMALSIALGRLLDSLLYGVRPQDPLTLSGAALILFAAAIASSAWPAWRSSRTDPATVLREN